MIEVLHLTKNYGDVTAVNDISFQVNEGEVVGFLGPNGAGKSTTLRILTGFMPATSGAVRVAGFDVLKSSLDVRRSLGYLPETVPVYPDMRVEEYLRFRALLKGVRRRDVRNRVDGALDRCGCADMRRRMIGKLSKGYRQRVGLADAIVHDPPILVLDEPTSGLDPNQRLEVRKLIQSLGEDKTVILSSHILAEVEATAERVLIVRRGEVVADGSPQSLVLNAGGGNRVRVEARGSRESIEAAFKQLDEMNEITVDSRPDGFLSIDVMFSEPGDHRVRIGELIAGAGATIRELSHPTVTLEDIFLRLTRDVEDAK